MKIVFTTTVYLPHIGGIEVYIHTIAQYLIEHGHKIVIIVADKYCDVVKTEILEGEKIVRLPAREISGFFLLKDKNNCQIVQKEIGDADVVHINVCKFLFGFLAKEKKNNHYRLIVTSHGWLYHTQKYKLIKNFYFRHVISKYAPLYDAIINVSAQDKKIAESFGIYNSCVIENGVNIYKYSKLKPKDKYDARFLYWGRIAQNKGILECLVKLSAYDRDFMFDIIGSCEDKVYERKLNDYISENNLMNKVIFRGRLNDNEIKEYIEKCDFILMPSLHEGFGMTLTECLLSERPIIANTNEAFISILKNVNAEEYLFDYEDVALPISRKIDELLCLKVTPQNVEQYSFQTMIQKTLNVYQNK